MKIREIKAVIGAKVLCCEDRLDAEVKSACASDMMSDVLAYVKNEAVLITGLCNPQVVRTAEMMDMKCIIIVRNKKPDEVILDLARQKGIVVLSSELRMFEVAGRLYNAGLVSEEESL